MHSLLYKSLYTLGAKYRNPSLQKHFKFLKETESWTLGELKAYQFQACKDFLIFSSEHSPYYKRVFRKSKFNPKGMTSFDDIKQIPILSKEDLLRDNDEIHSRYSFDRQFFSETSGSSGQVLTFQKNEKWDSVNKAAMLRGYSWYDVNPWEFNLLFWGYNISPSKRQKVRFLDSLQNRFRLFDYTDQNLESLVKRLPDTRYIHGYSSMIYQMARIVNEKGIEVDTPKLKMVKGTSEKIYPHYQPEVQKAFGKNIASEYGSAETGIIAFECPEGNMHVHMEGVYLEDDNGEIIVTNFVSHSFPVIRYKLGDFVKFAPRNKKCACGMNHPIIEEVEGRVGKNIFGQKEIYPSLTLYYVFKNLFFEKNIKLNYQCVQDEKGKMDVLIEKKMNPTERKALDMELEKYFKQDLILVVKDNQNIHPRDGKLRDFISNLKE